MATKNTPPEPQRARLTADELKAAIPKLKRRISELKAFDPASITDRYDPVPISLLQKIDDTLVEILGSDSVDYYRFSISSLSGSHQDDLRQSYSQGKAGALSRCKR